MHIFLLYKNSRRRAMTGSRLGQVVSFLSMHYATLVYNHYAMPCEVLVVKYKT
jgi:hypothetical protein